jgi:hypothetical protein
MSAPTVRGSNHVRAPRLPLIAAGLALCCSLLCSACGSKEAPAPERPAPPPGMPRARPTPTAVLPPVGSSPEGTSAPGANNGYGTSGAPRFAMPTNNPLAEQAPAEVDTPKARDYGQELSTLLKQNAPSCLSGWSPSRNGSVSIQVSAQVMATGAITRADASGSGLTPSILACMQKLATTLRMQAPIADAPRNVQTSLTLQSQGGEAPQPKAATNTANEDERDENPRDSRLQEVANDPPEVEQKDEPTREAPEPPEPRDLPPSDTRADEQP